MGMSDARAPAAHNCLRGSRAPIRETPAVPVSEKRRGSRDIREAPAAGQSAGSAPSRTGCAIGSTSPHLQIQGSKACISKPW